MWHIRAHKTRSTWYYFTENPQGGGFGSTIVASKRTAIWLASRNIPDGEKYTLTVNETLIGTFTKG